MYIADLHIHSRFSRATSKDCDLPHLDWWARRKGIALIGTGDFTHPAWRAELKEQLVPAGEGVYTLRKDLTLPGKTGGEAPRFVMTGEISSIYKRGGKTRKVHNLILLPSLEAAEELSAKLEAVGNIHSDGRPILGLDSRDLMELTLDTCPEAEFIPAHIWTPHFSMFGAFSGFETVEECFDELSPYIHAVETGLSSDPPMNWRVSALDRMTLVSHSDAHSPSKLGREADLIEGAINYPELMKAIRTGEGFLGTIEFFPEEGKYHLDGHRNCGVCLTPSQAMEHDGLCPVCGKKLTIGVEHRVEELADRPERVRPEKAKPFESLAPLPEVIAGSTGKSVSSKATQSRYEQMLGDLGDEFFILRQASISDIEQAAGPCIAEGIRRLRNGHVERKAGFDGEYGTITLLSPSEIEQLNGQTSLLGTQSIQVQKSALKKQNISKEKAIHEVIEQSQEPNEKQLEAINAHEKVIAVIAGPGTGKTKTLVSRIAYLIEEKKVSPSEITAVTFTNQAALEMRQRLEQRLGGKRAVSKMTIGTFHSICLKLLGNVHLISEGEAMTIAESFLRREGRKESPRKFLQEVSRYKNRMPLEDGEIDEELICSFCSILKEKEVLDFDDLLLQALSLQTGCQKNFRYLLVDEFQDINPVQYELIRAWSSQSESLFVIGDPDQSIYGFRGADSRCFEHLFRDFPDRKEIRLTENYRSSPEILESAIPVIQSNPGGERKLTAHLPSGSPVRLYRTKDDFEEGIFIAKEIGRITGGIDMLESQNSDPNRKIRSFSEIAVLCRTHRQLELIEKCLRHDDIPCVISGKEDFLEAKEVRGVLAFFHSLWDIGDSAALETALRFLWECPEDLIRLVQKACSGMKEFDSEAFENVVSGYGHLELWLDRMKEWKPLLKTEKPWKLIARWEAAYGTSPGMERLRNAAVFHDSMESLWNTLVLGSDADWKRAEGKGWKSGAVHLMTLHASKGLEFPAVFISGVKKGGIPLESKGRAVDVEEERRLFYVGMTRAKEELILMTNEEPSIFLDDLPESVIVETIQNRERPAQQLSLF